MRTRPLATAFLALTLLAAPVWAQRTTATIRGTVTDQSNAFVPGATVTLTGQDTGLTQTTTTNASGVYTFTALPVGRYTVAVELQGFKTATRTDISLNVADDRAVDFELQPGAITESVSVQAESTPVKTVGGDVSGVITGQQVRELPLNGRNFLQLATLMPGVSAPDFLNVKDKGLLGGSDLSVSGGSVTANMWTVDGANNNDVGSNRTILVYPSVDAIEEFKILRNSYGAEFGQAGGAQINIVTRGGTNAFHGSGFYFGRNDALDAKNFFLEKANQPMDELRRNDFGWTVGGPIMKDRLHFFASQEWNVEDRGTTRHAFVPTEAERNGDFSGPLIAGCSSPRPLDPTTGLSFPGNQIPSGRLSPAGMAYLNLYPLPNATPGAGSCDNWVTSLTTPLYWRQENIRVDYTITNSSRLMVRYTQDSWTNKSPSNNDNLWGDDSFPAVDSNWDQPGRSFAASLNQTIGSHAVNTLQFSYSANKITVTRGGTSAELNERINSLMPSIFPTSGHEYPGQEGHPVFWGAAGYSTLWNEAPFHNNQDLFVFKDDYSLVFGDHLVKAGALFSTNKKNEDVGGYGSYENSAFWGSAGLVGGNATGNILADFLLKDMTFGFSEFSAQRQVPQRWKDAELYVSDSWKLGPTLTLDYGLRYSLFMNPYAADDKIMSFEPGSFDPALGGDPCNGLLQAPDTSWCQDAGFAGGAAAVNRSLFPQDYNNFAPRVGIAWDVNGDGKSALRAGVGQFYLRERLSPGLNVGANPPFVTNISGVRTLDSNAEPCDDCFGIGNGAPNSGREQRAATSNNWQWNISYQREVLPHTTWDIGYVGNKGNDLLTTADINQVAPGDINGNGVDDRFEYASAESGAPPDVRPYGFGDHRITFWTHQGHSMYHSLQTQVISRWGGSQFQASYTLSRTRANTPLDNSSGSLAADETRLDLSNPDADDGLANTDRRHVFNAALVLAGPTMEGQPGLKAALLGGWEIGAIVQAASGQAITIFTGSLAGAPGVNLNGGPSGTGYPDNQRPNMASGVSCRADDSNNPDQILNPEAFTLTGFQLGTIGNEERGACRGPGMFQTDLAFYKTMRAGSRISVQLRFEIFNVFNRANFLSQLLNTTMSPSGVTLNADGTAIQDYTLGGNFGQATKVRDPRQMQFGLKIIF